MIRRILTLHWSITFLLLWISAFVFASSSIMLFEYLSANFTFIAENGLQAVRDGALVQLSELLCSALVSSVSFLVFKACERVLVDQMVGTRQTSR